MEGGCVFERWEGRGEKLGGGRRWKIYIYIYIYFDDDFQFEIISRV